MSISNLISFDFERFEANGISLMSLRGRVMAYERSNFLKRWYLRRISEIRKEQEIIQLAYWAFQKKKTGVFFSQQFRKSIVLLRPKQDYSILNACFAVSHTKTSSRTQGFTDLERERLYQSFVDLRQKQKIFLTGVNTILANARITPSVKRENVEFLNRAWARFLGTYLNSIGTISTGSTQEKKQLVKQARLLNGGTNEAYRAQVSLYQVSSSSNFWMPETRARVFEAIRNWREWFTKAANVLKKYTNPVFDYRDLVEHPRQAVEENIQSLVQKVPDAEKQELITYLEKEKKECESYPLNSDNVENEKMRDSSEEETAVVFAIKQKLFLARNAFLDKLKKACAQRPCDVLLTDIYYQKLKASFLVYTEDLLSTASSNAAQRAEILPYRQGLLASAEIEFQDLVTEKLEQEKRQASPDRFITAQSLLATISKRTWQELEEELANSIPTDPIKEGKKVAGILSSYATEVEDTFRDMKASNDRKILELQKGLWQEIIFTLQQSHEIKQLMLGMYYQFHSQIEQLKMDLNDAAGLSQTLRVYYRELEENLSKLLSDFFAQYDRSYRQDFINKQCLLNLKLTYLNSLKEEGRKVQEIILAPIKKDILNRLSDVRICSDSKLSWKAWNIRKAECVDEIQEKFAAGSDELEILITFIERIEAHMAPRINEPTSAREVLGLLDMHAWDRHVKDKIDPYRDAYNLHADLRDSEHVLGLYEAVHKNEAENIKTHLRALLLQFHVDKLVGLPREAKKHADAITLWLNTFKKAFDDLRESRNYRQLSRFFKSVQDVAGHKGIFPSVLCDLAENTEEAAIKLEEARAFARRNIERESFGRNQTALGELNCSFNKIYVLGNKEASESKNYEKWQKLRDKYIAQHRPFPENHNYLLSAKDLDLNEDLELLNAQAKLRAFSKQVLGQLKDEFCKMEMVSSEDCMKKFDGILREHGLAVQNVIEENYPHQSILQLEYRDWVELFSEMIEWHDIKLNLLRHFEQAIKSMEQQSDKSYRDFERVSEKLIADFSATHRYTYKFELFEESILSSFRETYLKYLQEKRKSLQLEKTVQAEEGSPGTANKSVGKNRSTLWKSISTESFVHSRQVSSRESSPAPI